MYCCYVEKEISGFAFKCFTEEQWKAIGLSDSALVAIQRIKQEKVYLSMYARVKNVS